MTIRVPVAVASGRKLFVPARAYANVADPTPADNLASVTVPVLPRKTALKVSAVAGRIVVGDQLAYLTLSKRARVTARVYVDGKAGPVVWARTFPGGTWSVRFPLPTLSPGKPFAIVLEAVAAGTKATTKLKLKA